MSLISLADLKVFLSKTDTADDDVLRQILLGVEAAIATYCGRTFESAAHREFRNGDSNGHLILENFPIISIDRIAIGRWQVLAVSYAGAVGDRASLRVTATTVVLTSVDTGITTTNTLTIADYVTVQDLADAINALGGWTAQVLGGYGNWEVSDIIPLESTWCNITQAYIVAPDDYDGHYDIEAASGTIYLRPWTGYQNVLVEYTAGYATIPADLQLVVMQLAKRAFNVAEQDGALQSERLGDYAWTAKAQDQMDSEFRMKLSLWRHGALFVG